MTVAPAYAPTQQGEPNSKDTLYNDLQDLVSRIPRSNILLILREWKAPTGPTVEYTHHILRMLGLSENGDRLVSFADLCRQVVTNTRLQHKGETSADVVLQRR